MPLCHSSTSPKKQWRFETPSIPPGTRPSSSMRWRCSATLRSPWPARPTSWWSFTTQTHMWVFDVCESFLLLLSFYILCCLWLDLTGPHTSVEMKNKLLWANNSCLSFFLKSECRRVHGPLCVPAISLCRPPTGLVPDSSGGQERRRAPGCLWAHTQGKGQRSPVHHPLYFIVLLLTYSFKSFFPQQIYISMPTASNSPHSRSRGQWIVSSFAFYFC